jgi:hypothetical protein
MIRFSAPLLALSLVVAACGVEEIPTDNDEILNPVAEEDPEPEPPPVEDKPVETLCGNDAIDEDEVCDNAEVGGLTCRHLGFGGGELACNDVCSDLEPGGCDPLSATPIEALGGVVVLEGSFDESDPTWSRPSASCEPGAEAGHRFDAFAWVNQTGAPQRVLFTATWGEGNDGFLHAFNDGADLRFLDDCREGNDDFEGVTGSRVVMDLAAGARVVIVTSTYAADTTFGPYALEAATVAIEDDPVVEPPESPLLPIALPGGRVAVDGNVTDGDASFARPTLDCAARAGDALGGASTFESVQVINETGADQIIHAAASYLDDGDGVLFVFDAGFDPSAPTAGCIGGAAAALRDLPIAAGEVLTFVVSSSAAPVGAWVLDIETAAPAVEDTPLVPIGEIGTGVSVSGDLTGAAVWNRVTQACGANALGDQPYRVHRIVNNTGGHQHIRITASWDGDGFLGLFDEDFLASDPSASCLAADDDWSANALPGSGTLGSRIGDIRMGAGDVLVIVASAFSATSPVGAYDIEVFTEDHDGSALLEMATDLGTHETSGLVHAAGEVIVEEDGTTRFYSAHLMRNHGDHEHGLELTATWADGADGVLRVHAFDESAPGGLGELLAFNDDFEGIAQSHISGDELRILDDAPFVIVATGFRADAAIGAYSLSITTTE